MALYFSHLSNQVHTPPNSRQGGFTLLLYIKKPRFGAFFCLKVWDLIVAKLPEGGGQVNWHF